MSGDAPPDNDHGPCPDCGLLYGRGYASDERYHRRVHDEAVNGHRAKLGDGFHAVTHQSLISLQKFAQAAASAARRETGYDFSSFTAIKKKADEYDTITMLCVKDGRICGLLVTRERECKYTARLNSFQSDDFHSWRPTEVVEVQPHARRAIDMIWTLKKNRKQGVAKGLVEALAAHCKMKTEDFAHMIPFGEDAVRLWKALKLSTIYVV
jgi:ribosomal protein S18 acetylase RimI-like enzyme